MNYKIVFYEKQSGASGVLKMLLELRSAAKKTKDARVQYHQVLLCLELLKNRGTNLPEKIAKHIEDGIWELRPGANRIFYFFYEKETFVLLHGFRKKTQKTPRREIEQAKRERADFLQQKEASKNENLG